MIRCGLIMIIKDLMAKGKRAGEIGVAENTARKYMTQPARPHGLKGRKKPSKLDSCKPYLQKLMDRESSTAWCSCSGFRLWVTTAV